MQPQLNSTQARELLNSKRSTILAEEAAAEAKAAADKEATANLAAAVLVQKFFKRKREATDKNRVGDETKRDYYELIRVEGLAEGKKTVFDTTGVTDEIGSGSPVRKQTYTLATLVALEVAEPTDFINAMNSLEAKEKAAAKSCCG